MRNSIINRLYVFFIVFVFICIWSLFTRNEYPIYFNYTKPGYMYYSWPIIEVGYPYPAFYKSVGSGPVRVDLFGVIFDSFVAIIVSEILLAFKRFYSRPYAWIIIFSSFIFAHLLLFAHGYLFVNRIGKFNRETGGVDIDGLEIGVISRFGCLDANGLIAVDPINYFVQVSIFSFILCTVFLFWIRHHSKSQYV